MFLHPEAPQEKLWNSKKAPRRHHRELQNNQKKWSNIAPTLTILCAILTSKIPSNINAKIAQKWDQ